MANAHSVSTATRLSARAAWRGVLFLFFVAMTSVNGCAFAADVVTQVVSQPAAAATTPPPTQFAPPPPLPSASPPSTPSAPAPAQPPSQMSANQFQQWLQTNGYEQQAAGQGAASSQPLPPPPFVSGESNSAEPPPPSPPKTIMHPQTYEESQETMRNSLPNSLVPPPLDSEYAFNSLLQQNMPMTPQQVVKLHQQIDLSQRAAATPPNVPPKPVSTTLMVNLAPGSTPPAIRLAQGYVSALVFVDSTGTPWPIAAFDIGNPKAVNIQWDGKSNVLLIQAVSPYANGDMVIRLVGLATPITLEIVSGQRVVDYRVDLHVSGIGPNTHDLPMGTPLPESANQLLLGVLDGVAPAGAKTLMVRGADAQAWLLGEKMYLRTRLTVLSPGWMGKMVSPDGMNAYELPRTSTVLVSRYGEPAELKVEGF